MATTSRAIAGGLLEFSKKMALGLLMLFAVQVIASVIVIAVHMAVADALTEFLRACVPVYVTGLAGYSAKAGVENALKIINDTKQITGEEAPKENG